MLAPKLKGYVHLAGESSRLPSLPCWLAPSRTAGARDRRQSTLLIGYPPLSPQLWKSCRRCRPTPPCSAPAGRPAHPVVSLFIPLRSGRDARPSGWHFQSATAFVAHLIRACRQTKRDAQLVGVTNHVWPGRPLVGWLQEVVDGDHLGLIVRCRWLLVTGRTALLPSSGHFHPQAPHRARH